MSDDGRKLTHLDEAGRPRMVDVGEKADADREAIAEGRVVLSPGAWSAVVEGRVPKGDVVRIAELAGIQGAKRTADLVPLCHPIPLDAVEVRVEPREGALHIRARVRTRWRTGVEMEAMTAVVAAALAAIDVLKALDRGLRIEGVRLLEKRGGRSGIWKAPDA